MNLMGGREREKRCVNDTPTDARTMQLTRDLCTYLSNGKHQNPRAGPHRLIVAGM